ncbi:hypothetical protein NliqN6_3910 [Naganishia liquefaciens]|uniref:DNA sliding clamp PCNA n=1 Tax=Naganishia liquefaciens TaxID=104408 RepID=A0A8H3TUU0_9TREE|nr:hypothetical protein NliqN6_3910 [Naganishia liquefaciens]
MLEARLASATVLKKLLDAIKELVTDCNLEANEDGIGLQAMDNSHVALVTVQLEANEFDSYRCDRNMPLGVNLGSLTKILKCAKDNDVVTIKASDDADSLTLLFESPNSDRIGEYDMKLMDIDQEHLGIPDTQYDATITFSSTEFARICRDLSALGESVKIEVDKQGIRFTADGEIGNGSVLLKHSAGRGAVRAPPASRSRKAAKPKVKKEAKRDPDDEEEGSEPDVANVESDEEDVKPDVQEEEEEKPEVDEDDEDEEEQEDDEAEQPKKRKAGAVAKKETNGRAKKAKDGEDDGEAGVSIILQQSVSLTFSLKYLLNFAKSAPLSKQVTLNMSNEVPLLVAFEFEQGHINYYLAPKIGDD